MTEHVSPSYIGLFYHVKTEANGTYSLLKRQGDRIFATYYVHRKSWYGREWLECDSTFCPSALYRSATACKHVAIVQAHIDAGAEESAVRWLGR